MKKIFKNSIFTFILGLFLMGTISAFAVNLIYSKDVTYDNTNSGLSSTTVQGALDELYEKAKNAPSCDSEGNCTVTCPDGKIFSSTDTGYKCSKSKPKLSDVLTITNYEYDEIGGSMNFTFTTTDNNIPLKITGYSNTTNSTDISTATKTNELTINSSNTSISKCWLWSRSSYNFIVIEDTSGKYTGNVISNTVWVNFPAIC